MASPCAVRKRLSGGAFRILGQYRKTYLARSQSSRHFLELCGTLKKATAADRCPELCVLYGCERVKNYSITSPSSSVLSGICAVPPVVMVVSPRITTFLPKVTSPFMVRLLHSFSEGGPYGMRCSSLS